MEVRGKRCTKRSSGEKMIPFGAKVYFKPSDARKAEAPSKFSPRGIAGVFAGYVLKSGMNWGRQCWFGL